MEELNTYVSKFDDLFKEYSDDPYNYIKRLVEVYDELGLPDEVANENFTKFLSIIKPIIAIKNYKSQIPFPENLVDIVNCLILIRSKTPKSGNALEEFKCEFKILLGSKGFQLPTVSAILHFCHPDSFPIVDTYVESACAFLKNKYKSKFTGLEAPTIPAFNTSESNKFNKYQDFIIFINKIKELQNSCGNNLDYRQIDKALMVLGKEIQNQKKANSK